MTKRLSHILIAAGLALGLLGALVFGVDASRKHQGSAAEIQSAIHQGEANAHVSQAQAIPDHAAELATAKADVAGARAEVERLRRLLAAQGRERIPDPECSHATDPAPVAPDHRDELLAADAVLIEAQAGQIAALGLALTDEQRRSEQFRLAYESERKATAAQEAATRAWKQAMTTSKWRGRIEGFAAGAALGYVGGRR